MAIKEVRREWDECQLDYVKEFILHTEADVADLPECCVGSTAIVGETGNVYVSGKGKAWKKREEAMEEGPGTPSGGGGQADWNAQEGEAGYIANKPFGYEDSWLLQETEVTTVSMPEAGGLCMAMFTLAKAVEVGASITICFNGVDYAYEYSESGMYGNQVFMGGDDTGEPFFFSSADTQGGVITAQEMTATVSVKEKVLKPLEAKYIPSEVITPAFIDLVEIGLPSVNTSTRVSVEHNNWKDYKAKIERGIVRVQFKFTGNVGDIWGNNSYGDVTNGLFEIFATLCSTTLNGDDSVGAYTLVGHYEERTFYFSISEGYVNAIAK